MVVDQLIYSSCDALITALADGRIHRNQMILAYTWRVIGVESLHQPTQNTKPYVRFIHLRVGWIFH